MTPRIESIVQDIHLANSSSVAQALSAANNLHELNMEEKNDLAIALTTIFYHHDHAGQTDMKVLAVRAEQQIARLGADVLPLLINELINADADAATYLGKSIALNGEVAIPYLLKAWEDQQDDDFAIINITQSLSYFFTPKIKSAIPILMEAIQSPNYQVRSMSLYTLGKLSLKLPVNEMKDFIQGPLFETVFNMITDVKPLVRKHAARTLGKMQKKNLLDREQQGKVFRAYQTILGKDGRHKWDRAFIVRHEASHFLPSFELDTCQSEYYHQTFEIIFKNALCKDTFYFEIMAPFIARKIQAGQFIMVRPNPHGERIPLSVCGWDRIKGSLQIIVNAVGKTTSEINHMGLGECFQDVVGPLGNRSPIDTYGGTCVVIGGGYGAGAIIPTARDLKALKNKVIGIIGARNKELLLMTSELRKSCDHLFISTNDGSEGMKGLVTDVLAKVIQDEPVKYVLSVGPVPMMKAISELTKPLGIRTYASLNAIMVDGTGMCGACRVTVGGKTRFACFHGPDFNAHDVDFDELQKRQKMFSVAEKKAFETLKI